MVTAEFSKFAGILGAALSEHHLLGFEKRNIIDIICSHWKDLNFLLTHKHGIWASQMALLVKNLPANAGDDSLIPGMGRSPG